jgi:cobalt-zinc-cadmium efflux system outer membrane protein
MGLAVLSTALRAQLPPGVNTTGLKQIVRESNPILAARRARVDAAVARRGAAGLLPPLIASAEVENVPSVINVLSAQQRVDFTKELVPSIRRAAERDVADRDVERARLEVEIAERALDAAIDQLVAKAAGAAAVVSRLGSEDSLLRGAEEALRTRFAVGDARYVDVLRLRAERLRLETEIGRGRIDERLSRRQIVRLGVPGDSMRLTPLLDAAVVSTRRSYLGSTIAPLPNVDSLMGSALVRQISASAVARAEALRRLTVAEQRPAASATLGLQRFAKESGGSSLGIVAGVSMPLMVTARPASAARVAVAEREIAVARADQQAAEAQLAATVARAVDRYDAARLQISAYDVALLQGAREEREAALAAYRNGSLTLIELLDFERALAQAEVARIRGQIEAADALLEFISASLGTDDILRKPLSSGGAQ